MCAENATQRKTLTQNEKRISSTTASPENISNSHSKQNSFLFLPSGEKLGLIGGAKGVLVGGLVGATATVSHWLGKHRSATLPAGTELTLELDRPLMMSSPSVGQ